MSSEQQGGGGQKQRGGGDEAARGSHGAREEHPQQRTGVGAGAARRDRPVKNLRITFWGTQGSVPIAPNPEEIDEYVRRVMNFTVRRVLEDLKARGNGSGMSAEQLLRGPVSEEAVAEYQKTLGFPLFPVYGGETTCVSVETSDGNTLIFDGGTGIRRCANELGGKFEHPGVARRVYFFGSHEHLDHRAGLPFCRFCYARPSFEMKVYGGRQFLAALDNRYGIFSHKLSDTTHYDDPIDYRMMTASFEAFQICDASEEACPPKDVPWAVLPMSRPVVIGHTTVEAFDVYHGPTRCLAYKVAHGGKTFVFCTDHEIRRGGEDSDPRQVRSRLAEERLRRECMDVDVAYFDGQYFLDEYMGKKGIGVSAAVSRLDWGHGCVEDVIERARACRIKRTLIGHLDPERTWPERYGVDAWLGEVSKESAYKVQLANGEESVEI